MTDPTDDDLREQMKAEGIDFLAATREPTMQDVMQEVRAIRYLLTKSMSVRA